MFARNIIPKHPFWLVLTGLLVCVSSVHAQSSQATTQSPEAESTQVESRRVDRLGAASTDEWEMDLALPGQAPESAGEEAGFELPDEDQNQELQRLLNSLALEPANRALLGQLNVLLRDVLDQANGLIDAGSGQQAGRLLAVLQSVDPALDGLEHAKDRLRIMEEIGSLVAKGEAALEAGRLLQPENSSALHYFNLANDKDPDNLPAGQGLERLQKTLVDRALESARELDFDAAESWLYDASAVRVDQAPVEAGRAEIEGLRQAYADELELKAIGSMNAGHYDFADFHIIDLIALGGQEERIDALRRRLEEIRHYGGFEPGQIISDELFESGGRAPEIVVIAAGSYLMGSRQGSTVAKDNEKPRHRITIEHGFGIGVKEVTVEEFQLFIERTGYRTDAERSGRSRVYDESAGRLNFKDGINWRYDYRGRKAGPDMPVLHVSVADAMVYTRWLSSETGKNYRLPSEAEYEYVARAGGSGTYWWGEGSPDESVENLTGERDRSPAKREWTTSFKRYGDGHWGPAPAGSFADAELKHPMGVLDITGNVSEWTEDCWHQNYVKAPTDGSAWVNPGCDRHVARGGYWASGPEQARAAFRIAAKSDSYGPIIGFRIARDL